MAQKRPRCQVRDISSFVDDEEEPGEHLDVAFIPGCDDSDGGSDSENESEMNSDTYLPRGSYEQVKSVYNNRQKRLEENHDFQWVEGAYENLDDEGGFISADGEEYREICLNHDVKMELKSKNAKELFELFFSSEIKEHIIESSSERGLNITVETLDAFVGILVLSIINSRKSYKDYWSTRRVLSCDIVASSMSRNTFREIKQKIKFYKESEKNDKDKVWKVKTLYDMFRQNCQQFGWFCRTYSIDEIMVKYFGHFGIKQCIRNKPVRFGIKQWAICSTEGYIFDVEIYTGKSKGNDNGILQSVGLGSRVVMRMLEGILNSLPSSELSKCDIYFDNFFTSPDLILHLKKLGLNATGTVRQNRVKGVYELGKKATRGSYIDMHDLQSNINYVTVMDSKAVSMLSTTYGTEPKVSMNRCVDKKRSNLSFPNMFSKYNKNMGGVDLHDQHCNATYPSVRGKKWTWCLFLRIIQASIVNATVLHNYVSPDEKKGTKDIIEELAEYYLEPKERRLSSRKRSSIEPAD